MKKTTTAVLVLIALLVVMLAAATACSEKAEYTSDKSAAELAAAVLPSLSAKDSFELTDDDYIPLYITQAENDAAAYSDGVVYSCVNTLVDECGFFKTDDADKAAALAEKVEAYLSNRKEGFTPGYAEYDAQKHKFEEAECRVIGVYVVYGILSGEDRAALFESAEEALAAK